MTYMVQCGYCFEIYDEYAMCPNCLEWSYINIDYDLGANR